MQNTDRHPDGDRTNGDSRQAADTPPGSRLSMHANVAVWCDCCSCEAEPYWIEAMRAADEPQSDD